MKFTRFLASISIVALFISGCSQAPSESTEGVTQIKVGFWGSPEEIQIVTKSMGKWQESHPDIKVRFEHTPYSGYDSKILTRIAGGAAPDVIATEVDYFVTFATRNVFVDLKQIVETDDSFSIGDFFPAILGRFTVGDAIYAIPRDVAPFACVYYNKQLFDDAGIPYPNDDWTWEQMLDIAKRLTKKDESGRTVQYGFFGWAWQNFIYGNGGGLVDDVQRPTRSMLDDPASIEGLQFYADLINKHGVMPSSTQRANLGMGADHMFASGRLAMFLSGIWETPGLRSKYDFRWDVAMFPKNKNGIRKFGSGGTGYGILKSSKHPDKAWEVVKALTSFEVQAEMASRGLAQPARRSVAEGDSWAKSDLPPANKKMLNEAVEYIVFDPFHKGWREIKAKFIDPQLDLLESGKRSAAEVLTSVSEEINEFLAASN